MAAQVRVQAYCSSCQSVVDATVPLTKTRAVIEAFDNIHPPECFTKEEPRGEEEAKPTPGAADAAKGDEPAETATDKVH